ncbi:tape measure protein [Shewanella sp. SP2S2-6]|uniref:tape measure protein n=1 Tax=Shewanella sp. SP2S2-6 TaxID=3063540 RepID=UPI00288E9066|nr:tape measure protein [Shewanella sp. SP2S2-6]MDT3296457.1 tape measure protein [Shewanella sp. SP2S2-6]
MSFKDQVINLIIQGRDLFSSEAAKSEKALQELANQSEVLNERLDDLKQQQAAIKAIDDLTAAITKGEKGFIDGSRALEQFSKEQKQAAQNLKQLEQAQKEAATSTSKLETEYSQTVAELSKYDEQLAAARAEVERLTATQDKGAEASKDQAQALAAANADLQQLETAQKNTASSANQLATELEQERIELKQLSSEVDQASQKKAEYALRVKGARTELNQLGSSLGRNKAELDKQQTVLNKAGIDMNKLADASKDLKTQEAAAEIAIKGVNDKLARHNKLLDESKKSSSDFGGSIKAATGSLIAMAGAYVGVDRLWESLKSILTAGDKAASFSAQMTAMMGSIAGGEQATAWIKDFANRTGTQLDSAKQAFASLKTFGIDPMNGALQSMVDYNAKLGGSQEKLEGIILATGQAWAKQKLQGEEILQLVERGVPVWDLLEKVTGKNTVQLGKLSEAGKLGREVMQQLFDEMGKQANGQAALSLDRLSGQLNLLSNKWESFKQIIADSGAYQVAIDLLKDINTSFDQLNQSGKIKAAAQDISDFFKAILKDGGASLKGMLENITAFATGLNVVAGSIRLVFNVFTSVVATFGAAISGVFALILQGWATVIGVFGGDELAQTLQTQANALKAVSKAYLDQVEQDARDATAALKQMGVDIRLDSDGTTQTQVDNAEKVKAAVKSQLEQQIEASQQAVAAAEKANESATKEVDAWKAREQAAKEHYTALKNSGTATLAELEAAQIQLENATLRLGDVQLSQLDKQDKLALSNMELMWATIDLRKEQNQLAQDQLSKVRDAFISGQASVDDYQAAQDKAKKTATELAKAQTQLTEEVKKTDAATSAYEAAMLTAGIKTIKVLRDQAAEAKNTFDLVKKGTAEGTASTYELNQAFLKYAEAALKAEQASLKVGQASDGQVEASLRQQAATMGLAGDIDKLIAQYSRLKDAQSGLGDNTQQTADNVKKGSTEIGTTISNTMDTVEKSAEQAGIGLQSIAQYFADIGTAIYENVKALSDGAARYFNTIVYGVQNVKKEFGDLGQVENEIERLTGVIYELDNTLAKTVDFVGLRTWALETEKAGKIAERAYYRQKLELLNLVDALDNTDKANLSIINSATRATKALDLVNDQDMSLLTSALESAKQRMDSLRDSAESTLKSLQDELDGYLGRQDEIEKRRYQEQVADLKEQLAAAERTGDKQLIADLHEAERTLKQVYEFRTAEIKTQQATDKQSAAEAKKQAEASAATAKTTAQNQATVTVNTQANTQTSTQSVANTSDMQVLQLQVGNSTFNAQMKRSLVTELMNEIKRLQSVGG